nr:pyridoxal-dependent decarboxylase [Candidatus Dormibacteraeota bacterium]
MNTGPTAATSHTAHSPSTPTLHLDVSRERVLKRAAELIATAWRSFDQPRDWQPSADDQTTDLFAVALPEEASPALSVIDDAALVLDESITPTRPRYFGFVGASGLEIGAVADFMAACFDVNLAVDAAAATRIDRLAGQWVATFVGYPKEAAVTFTSGGTLSNLTALTAARERALAGTRRRGMSGVRAAVYTSRDAHHSVVRAAEVLGIGSNCVRSIAVDARRRMIPEALAAAISRDRDEGVTPVATIATAGTTLVGA